VAANVGPSQTLASGAPIELFFDRLLLPVTVTRQTFVLTDLSGNGYDVPVIAYDPVARVVSLRTLAPLPACQSFRVYLASPANNGGLGWVQAIDGAPLDPSTPPFLEFTVAGTCATGGDAGTEAGAGAGGGDAGGDAGAAPVQVGPSIDFCGTILPIFRSNCAGTTCHGGTSPAVGLALDTSQSVVDTAINRVSVEANQGPQSLSQPPSTTFGLDMPIIDSTGGQGNAGDSWLIYKLLLATPPATTPTTNLHSEPWSDMGASERTTLGNYVIGSEMPFPMMPGAAAGTYLGPLSLDQLEQISFWIQQGAAVPPCAE